MNKNFKYCFVLFLPVFFLCGAFVFAQEDAGAVQEDGVTAFDLGIEEPTLLPDSSFYFLKEWGRSIGNFFTLNPVKKAERKLMQANERIVEAEKISQKTGNEQIVEKTLEKYQKTMEEVKERIEKVEENEKDNSRFQSLVDKFTEDALTQSRLIYRLRNRYENAPEEMKEKIEAVRERTEERLGDVLNEVDEEQAAGRLERVLEKVQAEGGEINANQIETLRRVQIKLREKLPEPARADEVINRVIEERVERIKEKSTSTESVGLANPASVYCESRGGYLRMEEGGEGVRGICIFSNGAECEEWSFFRGECGGDSRRNLNR